MKNLLILTTFLANFCLASPSNIPLNPTASTPPKVPDLSLQEILRKADSALIAQHREDLQQLLLDQHAKDSILFANKIPDSLRALIEKQTRDFEANKKDFDSVAVFDSLKISGLKLRADSMRRSWEAKRDTQISRIKDTATRARIQARIAQLESHRLQVKARTEARKAVLEAKIADLKARIQKLNSSPNPH